MGKQDRYDVKPPGVGGDGARGRTVRAPLSPLGPWQSGGRRKSLGSLVAVKVRVQGRDGRFRDSDMVPPRLDPNPPRERSTKLGRRSDSWWMG